MFTYIYIRTTLESHNYANRDDRDNEYILYSMLECYVSTVGGWVNLVSRWSYLFMIEQMIALEVVQHSDRGNHSNAIGCASAFIIQTPSRAECALI